MQRRRLWAVAATSLGLWTALTGAGTAGPVPGAGATAATPLGLVAQVALAPEGAYPRAFVVAYHDEAGTTTLEVEVCESQESCLVHSALVRADALVDVGGAHNGVVLLTEVEGLGPVRLRFASSGSEATSPVGCAGSKAAAVMQKGETGRVEQGAVTGVIGERGVRSSCSAAGRNATLAYAVAPAPPAASV